MHETSTLNCAFEPLEQKLQFVSRKWTLPCP